MSPESERSCVRGGAMFLTSANARSTPHRPSTDADVRTLQRRPAARSPANFPQDRQLTAISGAGHAHRNVIFFSAGRGHIVDARRMGEHSRFVEQRSRRDMRDHETRIANPGCRARNAGSPSLLSGLTKRSIRRSLMLIRSDHRDGGIIKCERERRAMKIST